MLVDLLTCLPVLACPISQYDVRGVHTRIHTNNHLLSRVSVRKKPACIGTLVYMLAGHRLHCRCWSDFALP
ncbi:hypothetical protein F5B22DRAFT_587970 [Xylaria bambusicola]|uniref:uncharacterized protein n=1 Tax=Xylaria bambusicola TaxID=326684 RepID=UPI00200880C0|nr:uncharacterized protein F5B22DRAFT_587970 [Xylaria bambusicola]KAI0525844.1 hypothetical protein F5B22DRAFT_587970 [Xylaria bambusicola]